MDMLCSRLSKQAPVTILALSLLAGPAIADTLLLASYTDTPPVVDGHSGDQAWESAQPLQVIDAVAGIPITLKAVYTDQEIFILATFPDANENRTHQTYHWNADLEAYLPGNDREDMLIFKWSMVADPGDLTLSSTMPYEADVWFWKAARTDPAGYADDKHHIYTQVPSSGAQRLISSNGELFFLLRKGDEGEASYYMREYEEYVGDVMPQYGHQAPSGSRGDVRAWGNWAEGHWTIEFQRKLDTGHTDDLAFRVGEDHLFGISRYEISGKGINRELEEPLYGAGDIGPLLTLRLVK